MAKFKVYISDYDYPDLDIERSVLEPIGAEVIGLHCNTGEELAELAADADVILQQYAKINRSTIEKLTNCKAICRYGTGVDIIDIKAAYDHGMVVTNVPDYCIEEVADHTITMGLMLLRRIPMYNKATHEGIWHWSASNGPIFRFRGTRWGLIGFGRIAQNIARKLNIFGFDVMSYDPYISKGFMNTHGVRKVDLDELFSEANVVNVMCPYTPETHHIVNEEAFNKMSLETVLVNCSRGKCVDNQALYKSLVDGRIASAGLDDTEEEPAKLSDWSPDMNPLFTLENCYITPHSAYVSEQSLIECRYVAAENARAVLLDQKPLDQVWPKEAGQVE
ncbi:MAG: C-terminal binding protein [Syntrophaceae bacterium]|nr:C-terminal binding protein [Syntrophaceae bacterium]